MRNGSRIISGHLVLEHRTELMVLFGGCIVWRQHDISIGV